MNEETNLKQMSHEARLNTIARIIELVEHRASFGATVTPTLKAMTQEEISRIYLLAKGE